LNSFETLNKEMINNPYILSMMMSKLMLAKEKSVNFTTFGYINFNLVEFDKKVISKVMGILLDNAIESAKKTEERLVDVEFYHNILDYKIIIKNSIPKNTKKINVKNLYKKDYSTKEEPSGIRIMDFKKN